MYSYLEIFGAVLSTIVLPLPEEAVLLGAGWAAHAGKLWPPGALVAAWSAIWIGDTLTFLVGRAFPNWKGSFPEKWVRRHGWRAIAIGRFLVGARPAVFLAVGAARYSTAKFLLVDGVVGLFEVGLLLAIGYFYGQVRSRVGVGIDLAAGAILALALIGPLLIKRRLNGHPRGHGPPGGNSPRSARLAD